MLTDRKFELVRDMAVAFIQNKKEVTGEEVAEFIKTVFNALTELERPILQEEPREILKLR
jgi:predicted transcriptional regulator